VAEVKMELRYEQMADSTVVVAPVITTATL
jgi:hypothetical protein